MSETRRVTVIDLDVHVDDRGELFEVLRCDDREFVAFGQVYFIRSRAAGTVRAFHRHERLVDHFVIVNGAAKFGFVDAEPGTAPRTGNAYYITASERKAVRIDVPAGCWHGWVSLEPNTLLVSVASELYMGENREGELDEERLPPDSFDARWEVEAK